MGLDLRGQAAVVAGGAGGLGSATVRHLAAHGAGIVILDPDEAAARALVDELDGPATAVTGDALDDDAIGTAIESARTFGAFTVAVCATGVVIPSRRLVSRSGSILDLDVFQRNFDLHVLGPVNLARHAAAAFATNTPTSDGQRGVVVLTASISAFDGQVSMVPYAAAKGAVVSMVLPMARDLAPLGVRVCAIAPGGFATPRLSDPAVQDLLAEDTVFPRRLGRPDEFAELVGAIVANPYLNGEVIRLDGATRLSPQMGPPPSTDSR